MDDVKWVDELTWADFKELVHETDIGVVPVGSIEQHGLHAPLGTDNFIAEELSKRIASRVKVILYPVIKLGHCVERGDNSGWPGTISISSEVLMNLYIDLGRELVRHGMRRILFVNGHLNNASALTIAAFKIWKETGAAVGILDWFFAVRKEIAEITKGPTHADEVETSVLLATKKAVLVDLGKAAVGIQVYPPFDDEKVLWDRGLFHSYTFESDERYKPKGNYGDPRKATKEIGDWLMDVAVGVGVAMLEALKKHVSSKQDGVRA